MQFQPTVQYNPNAQVQHQFSGQGNALGVHRPGSGSYLGFSNVTNAPGQGNLSNAGNAIYSEGQNNPSRLLSAHDMRQANTTRYIPKPANDIHQHLGTSIDETNAAKMAHADTITTVGPLVREVKAQIVGFLQDSDQHHNQADIKIRQLLDKLEANCEKLDRYQANETKLEEKIHELCNALQHKTSELKHISKALEVVQKDSEDALKKLELSQCSEARAVAENVMLKNQKTELENKMDRIVNGYKATLIEHQDAKEKIETKDQGICTLKHQISNDQRELKTLQSFNNTMSEKVDGLNKALTTAYKESKTKDKAIEELGCQVSVLQDELKKNKDAKDHLECQLKDCKKQLTQASKRAVDFRDEAKELNEKLRNANESFENARVLLHASDEGSERLLKNVGQARNMLKEVKGQRDLARQNLLCAEKDKENAEEKIKHLQHELSNTLKVVNGLRAKLASTGKQLEAKDVEVRTLKENLSSVENKRASLEDLVNNSNSHIAQLETTIDNLSQQLQSVSTEPEEKAVLQARVEQLQTNLLSETRSNELLCGQLNNAQQDITNLTKRCNESQKQIEMKTSEIQDLRTEMMEKNGVAEGAQRAAVRALSQTEGITEELTKSGIQLKELIRRNEALTLMNKELLERLNQVSISMRELDNQEKLGHIMALLHGSTPYNDDIEVRSNYEAGQPTSLTSERNDEPLYTAAPFSIRRTVPQFGTDSTSDEGQKQKEATAASLVGHLPPQSNQPPQDVDVDERLNDFLRETAGYSLDSNATEDNRGFSTRYNSFIARPDIQS